MLRIAAISSTGAIIDSDNLKEETSVDHYAIVNDDTNQVLFNFNPAAAIPAVNTGTLNTGDATSDTVIGDIRTKLNSVITALHNTGLIG